MKSVPGLITPEAAVKGSLRDLGHLVISWGPLIHDLFAVLFVSVPTYLMSMIFYKMSHVELAKFRERE